MTLNKETPGPSRGAQGSQNAQLAGREHQQDTTSAPGCQGILRHPQRLALRTIHDGGGRFQGLEVVYV